MMGFRRSLATLLLGTLMPLLTGAQLLTSTSTPSSDSCTRPNGFKTTVIVEHEVTDRTYSDKELETLAIAFRDVYNLMNAPRTKEEICDAELLRAVEKVKVAPMKMLYKPYEGQVGYRRQFLYTATGRCVNCDKSTSLFDKGKARSLSDLNSVVKEKSGCQCSSKVSDSNTRGPTETEFKRAFKETVQKLFSSKEYPVEKTLTADRVSEVVGGKCEIPQDPYSFTFEIELSVEPNDKDLVAVQDSFVNTYRFMETDYCDPKHYNLHSVDLTHDVITRKVRRKLGKRRLLGGGRGTCNDCGSGSGIGDDTGGRRLEQEGEKGRLLWEASGCYCSKTPKGYRIPSRKEFVGQMNKTLNLAHAKGFLSEPIEVLDLLLT